MSQSTLKPLKRTNWGLRLLLIIVFLVIIIIYSRILVSQIRQRAYISSTTSVFAVRTISVGIGDYGQIIDMNVEVGSSVKQGEKIFTYLKSGDQPKEVSVRATVNGTVKEIVNDLGSYITRDDKVLLIQSDSVRIQSEFNIPPEQINFIKVGNATITTIPGQGDFNGKVSLVYPTYNSEKKLLKIDSILEKAPLNVLEGVPVQTKVYIGDDIATYTNNLIQNIPSTTIRDYLDK